MAFLLPRFPEQGARTPSLPPAPPGPAQRQPGPALCLAFRTGLSSPVPTIPSSPARGPPALPGTSSLVSSPAPQPSRSQGHRCGSPAATPAGSAVSVRLLGRRAGHLGGSQSQSCESQRPPPSHSVFACRSHGAWTSQPRRLSHIFMAKRRLTGEVSFQRWMI